MITALQFQAEANSPNFALLEKLKHEMQKLQEQRVCSKSWQFCEHVNFGRSVCL